MKINPIVFGLCMMSSGLVGSFAHGKLVKTAIPSPETLCSFATEFEFDGEGSRVTINRSLFGHWRIRGADLDSRKYQTASDAFADYEARRINRR